MWIKEKKLEGDFVILEPIHEGHVEPLKKAVQDGESWKLWYATVPKEDEMRDYVIRAIESARKGDIAYAVRAKSTCQIVGATRYYDVDETNRRATIGFTWYAASVRRTPINTECKFLLLKNLFETHDAIAAEFRTHFFNRVSRTAILRLGAKRDGILRSHKIMKDGSIRDTVVYSIISGEWPAVKRNLISKIKR